MNGRGPGGIPPSGKPVMDMGVLVVPLLISIPVWAAIGVAIVLVYLDRRLSEVESAVLVLAAAAELALLRHAWRRHYFSPRRGASPVRPVAGQGRAWLPSMRRPALMVGAAAAYLHYYFWDVQLQIAALPSLTVFARAPAIG
ncbi:MAG: hypothetical protein OEV81_14525 [Betaproteobacteria bacterium]|nr:hypothetical protein [Betaproteobacteria bacterium]MDH5223066.1 hypothetical protein [Betaproteobacteria bacterium]